MSGQVRSVKDELDWESKVHVFYVNLSASPLPRLDFSGTLSYTVAEGEMDSPSFPAIRVTTGGGRWTAAYYPELMHNADEYSDLDYQALELELEATYQILDNLSFTLNYWYSDFDDDEEYVYGDLDGEAYVFTGFITYRF